MFNRRLTLELRGARPSAAAVPRQRLHHRAALFLRERRAARAGSPAASCFRWPRCAPALRRSRARPRRRRASLAHLLGERGARRLQRRELLAHPGHRRRAISLRTNARLSSGSGASIAWMLRRVGESCVAAWPVMRPRACRRGTGSPPATATSSIASPRVLRSQAITARSPVGSAAPAGAAPTTPASASLRACVKPNAKPSTALAASAAAGTTRRRHAGRAAATMRRARRGVRRGRRERIEEAVAAPGFRQDRRALRRLRRSDRRARARAPASAAARRRRRRRTP